MILAVWPIRRNAFRLYQEPKQTGGGKGEVGIAKLGQSCDHDCSVPGPKFLAGQIPTFQFCACLTGRHVIGLCATFLWWRVTSLSQTVCGVWASQEHDHKRMRTIGDCLSNVNRDRWKAVGRAPSLFTGMNPGFDIHHTIGRASQSRYVCREPCQRAYPLQRAQIAPPRDHGLPVVYLHRLRALPTGYSNRDPPLETDRRTGQTHLCQQCFEQLLFHLLHSSDQGPLPQLRRSSIADADSIAIVSQAFVRQFWPANDPLGKSIITHDGRSLIVVGVAADTQSDILTVSDSRRFYTLPRSFGAGR